jgi:hypothetical protein
MPRSATTGIPYNYGPEQSRYRTNRPEVFRSIIEAIGDRNHGILRWIKRYW